MSDKNIPKGPEFTGKIFIKGKIAVLTGLHIGGSKAELDIGGIDLSVIKTADFKKIPYIPGSSLKGKLRSLLAREKGKLDVKEDTREVKEIFGYSADDEDDLPVPTRLIVRDAFMEQDDQDHFTDVFDRDNLETAYTESKTENTIDRRTGTANNIRQIERVPAQARFTFEMIYNVYDDGLEKDHIKVITKAMRLLEDDYLGGHGSRGYGRIKFEKVKFERKKITHYENNLGPEPTVYTY